MRLIDADTLEKDLKSVTLSNGTLINTNTMIALINKYPTVYDIDKVVEELEENASRYTKKYVTPYGNNGYRYVKAISVNKAVEIVKHVGASDDVCEWEQSGDMAINPHTFSKYKIKQCAGVYALNTCPYCEKKIKVVELWRD